MFTQFVRLELRGELDLASGAELAVTIDALTATPGVARIVIDATGIEFIDTAGIDALNAAVAAGVARGIVVGVDAASAAVRHVLDLHTDLKVA